MALQCGIVGLPNVGKSTFFNALTKGGAQAANFPFCTIEPNVGVIQVPDPRLQQLNEMVNPKSLVPNTIEFVDIAGLVKGASKGEGLGNQFLGNIRSTDAIIHIVRCFQNDNVVHVDGSVDPVRDKDVIDIELQLKDLEMIDKVLDKSKRAAKSLDKEAVKEVEVLEAFKALLESGRSAREMSNDDHFDYAKKHFDLLTIKPVLYVANVDEASVKNGNDYVDALKAAVKDERSGLGGNAEVLIISCALEEEIAMLDDQEEREMFLAEYGLAEPGTHKVVRAAYALLNLITFFTAGEKEVRAWTLRKGYPAPKAAGVIHTDFEKGFIRAEVIKYDDFVQLKSEAACRDAGKLHVEGKAYTVDDGDIMHFLFNV